jgi:hypothetical protein
MRVSWRSMTVQDDRPFDVLVPDAGIQVQLPSGATFYVITQDEADYLNERVTRYLSDNHFVNVADFQDVDKMVTFELFIHRWNLWLSKGKDYYNDDINAKQLADTIATYSSELRQLKKALNIDKTSRDKQRGDDSVPAYLDALRQRAREFGYMRNAQFQHVIESFQRISAYLTYYDNCTEQERIEQGVTLDDVIVLIRETIAEFNAIDETFRKEKQSMWVRKQ